MQFVPNRNLKATFLEYLFCLIWDFTSIKEYLITFETKYESFLMKLSKVLIILKKVKIKVNPNMIR